MKKTSSFIVAVFLVICSATLVHAQGTSFTYQGRLNDGTGPANGTYDLRFSVYDAATSGTAVGGPLVMSTTAVSNGLFTVALDFGGTVFNGSARWLAIEVRTNGASSFISLNPRQQIAATPYAITASNLTGTVSSSSLSGAYSSPVSLLNGNNVFSGALFSGNFSGNGSGLTSLSANQLTGIVPDANLPGNIARTNQTWLVAGNSGTTPANNFLGTLDNQPLEFRAFNQRALRLEPTTNGANVIAGAPNNFVDPGIVGATIAGGGAVNYYGDTTGSNHVGAVFGTIGGGRQNTVNADHSTIAGGYGNIVSSFAYDSVISGGVSNIIQPNAVRSTIGGGILNQIYASRSVIAGGAANTNAEWYSTIGGGLYNSIQTSADHSFIGGGQNNVIQGTIGSAYHTISGGYFNTISTNATYGTIAGGQQNIIQSNAVSGFIGGGTQNKITTNSFYATIGGGVGNSTGVGSYATVGGGSGNFASGVATVGGGSGNIAMGDDATVAGGGGNVATNGVGATVGGGFANKAAGANFVTASGGAFNQASGDSSTVAGGQSNGANGQNSTVGGGLYNLATGYSSTIPGGQANHAFGDYSFAAGLGANATNTASFVWSDASDYNGFGSTTSNQFNIRAFGGVRLVTGGAGLTIDGITHYQSVANSTNVSNIVNVVDGSSANYVASGVNGAVISGGGATKYFSSTSGSNSVTADFGTVSGGIGNSVTSAYGTVGGGYFNINGAGGGTISGGDQNQLVVNATYAGIASGYSNYSAGAYSFIGGGAYNNVSNATSSTIGGGSRNSIYDGNIAVTIPGGTYNTVSSNSYSATIGGGEFNTISNNGTAATIGGGHLNGISPAAQYATVPGGSFNTAGGINSFAAGHRAKAAHDGAFVWADNQEADFTSTAANQMLVRASGGVAINTNNPGTAALNVNGTVKATAFQGDGSQLSNINVGALGNFVFAYTGSAQTPAAANTYQDISFNTDVQISGWTHTAGTSQYTNNQAGIYMVNYDASAQATSTAGTNFVLHATLNSSEIPGSRTIINTIGGQIGTAGRSFMTSAAAGDILTIQFQASATGARLLGNPSVSMTITRVQ